MYALVGYDKDNDVYETITTSDNISFLIEMGKEAAIKENWYRICDDGSKEFFDWFEVVDIKDAEYPNTYYWASYLNVVEED